MMYIKFASIADSLLDYNIRPCCYAHRNNEQTTYSYTTRYEYILPIHNSTFLLYATVRIQTAIYAKQTEVPVKKNKFLLLRRIFADRNKSVPQKSGS